MNKQNNTRAIVEAGILTAIEVVIILFSFYIPLFYFIGLFLSPIPVALLYVRHNIKYSILLIVAAAVLSAILSDPVSSLGFMAIYGILGIILGYCIIKKESAPFTILIMSVAVFISTLVGIKLFSIVMGQDEISNFLQMITGTFNNLKQYYIQAGIPQQTIDTLMDPSFIKMILPLALAVNAVTVSFVTYVMAQSILRRFGYVLDRIKPFSQWYIPAQLVIGTVLLIIAGYIASASGLISVNQVLINTGLIFQLIFSVDGLAALSFYLKRVKLQRGFIFFICIFLFLTPANVLLPYIGLTDYIFNLRKLDAKRLKKRI